MLSHPINASEVVNTFRVLFLQMPLFQYPILFMGYLLNKIQQCGGTV